MKKILIGFILLIFCIGFVSASENTTDIQTVDNQEEIINDNLIKISSQDKVTDSDSAIYVNSTKEVGGDGYSWENASKSITLNDNATIFLAEGEYDIPGEHKNVTYIGLGKDTVITSFSFRQSYYFNTNHTVIVINATFKPHDQYYGVLHYGIEYENVHYNILVDEMNFKFINCIFINSEFLSRTYERTTPNRDTLTDVISASFENCTFKDFNGKYLVNNWEFSKFEFNKCIFENITSDAIIDSYGGRSDSQGRVDGVYIHNSTFKNCNIKGIVKARQIDYCEIINCTYDFNARSTKDSTAPFYVNKTQGADDLIETKLTVESKDNSIIITLTDIYDNPIVDVEVGIFNITNGLVYDYQITDNNGQIILNNLVGNYNFEFSYLGDPYEYLPTSLNKSFTFESITPTVKKIDSKIIVSNINTVYNTAKKWTFTLKEVNNNVLANKKVTVKLDKNYEVTTNNNGQAILTLPANLIPKTYTAIITFAGDNNYNKVFTTAKVVVSKATPKLTTKKLTTKVKVKTKKVTATLKGVPKNTKVTLKLKGKTYTAKTNKKGVATFKVTKLNKKGTFKGTVKFAGNKYFKAVSKSVQIKVK